MGKIFSKSTISVVMLALLALAVAVSAHGGHINKSVKIAAGSQSSGASSVNGSITVGAGAVVAGDIELSGGAEVRGDIIVEKPGGWWRGNKETRMPEVVIGPGSRVHGNIHLERVVKLYISETAEVGGVVGEISMSDAVRFSGKRP